MVKKLKQVTVDKMEMNFRKQTDKNAKDSAESNS